MPRTVKYRVITTVERLNNRLTRALLRRGWAPPWFGLLETTGRRSGLPRQTPVGNGLDGDTFWVVAVHGRQADYVRNIIADPRVRVRVNGRWRGGTAILLPGDDPIARSRTLRYQWDAALGRMMATTPLTIRIDLVHDEIDLVHDEPAG
jgi:deazaflavin-dependent oxidoreductase (nitroreductase family)